MLEREIKLQAGQCIVLEANRETTPARAVNAAILVCKKYAVTADLYYDGFMFGIDADSDINELVADYRRWVVYQAGIKESK